ncbi:tannase/feruloyl esterase family alpha/beta hydrolase [Sphingomonas oryzagri]|uniref:Tannase/feruloyl esterase family alpha/beta hydrolase n=1 Tax=Sphingomonas oryzagri TaxID=3042314 RepID=A0ABT6N1U4_9SPHN|nr:tannase/feruloyl esterase family alpha/beta hydrolase [Sphingomonas oryzagri]MDH7639264.1 tannase/feruloyl esterase family alpha/beta hydrolase [Sphingomonas oryzagri]
MSIRTIAHGAGWSGPLALFAALLIAAILLIQPKARGAEPSGAAGVASLAAVPATSDCAALAKVDLVHIGGAGSVINSAVETVGAQQATVCAVEGTLAPAIKFRVELPTKTWTQRYLQTGCGGLCGNLNIRIGAADGCPTVDASGFVVASSDMGHEGMDGDFGRDPQKRADFAYRGVHLTAVAAKALIHAFYGQGERFSYFSGCSDGGREALVEAQRFPEDFNGIVAGAPAMNFVVQNSLYHAWQARSNTGPDGGAILLASRLPILHAAVLKACDGLDGQVDGLISAPGQCRFDPAATVCRGGQDPSTCLTAQEAEVARRFYAGPRDPKTGERLTVGGPQYGSELQWAGVYVPMAADQPIFSSIIANGSMGNLIFSNGQPATVDKVTFDHATFERLVERYRLFDSTSPDLSAFADRGGKLILFHGWADPHISPINTIAYNDALKATMGEARAASFERLYLMPGMGHCSGGEGPSAFDLLTPVMAWVEGGRAPDAIVTRTPTQTTMFGLPGGGHPGPAGPPPGAKGAMPPRGAMGPPPGMPPQPTGPARSRPVYPYPYIAAYTGTGDPNAASSWMRGRAVNVQVPAWAGTGLYRPYQGVTG